jgi:hypothetical protein
MGLCLKVFLTVPWRFDYGLRWSLPQKEDSRSVVFEVAEAVGGVAKRLSHAVEFFGRRVGDPMTEVVQQALEMSSERFRPWAIGNRRLRTAHPYQRAKNSAADVQYT